MINSTKFILPVIIFLLTLVSGVWLSNAGKPYNNAIFTIHKLIALGAVVLAAIQIIRGFKTAGASPLTIMLFILAILAAIALFATGALMSLEKGAVQSLADHPPGRPGCDGNCQRCGFIATGRKSILTTYKSVCAIQRSGPETMQIIEKRARTTPAGDQVRVHVLASCVTMPDVQARYGDSPFKIKLPRSCPGMPSSGK